MGRRDEEYRRVGEEYVSASIGMAVYFLPNLERYGECFPLVFARPAPLESVGINQYLEMACREQSMLLGFPELHLISILRLVSISRLTKMVCIRELVV